MNKKVSLLLVFIIIAGLFTGCNSKDIGLKDTLVVATPVHNGLYNPLYAATDYDKEVCSLIFESLVIEYPHGRAEVNPRLVKEFKASEDGAVLTFTLNEGITFSNGTPLTAYDVEFTFKTLGDNSSTASLHHTIEDFQGGKAYMKGESHEFSGVVALDDSTVVFTFTSGRRTNLKRVGVPLISKEYYPDWEVGNVDFSMHEKMSVPVGTGPYMLKEFVPSEKVVLVRNENYWGKKSEGYKIPKIIIQFMNPDQQIEALQNGEVDLLPHFSKPLPSGQVWKETVSFPRNSYGFIGFNTGAGASADRGIRQAIAYSINREAFVKECFGQEGQTLIAPLPASSDWLPVLGATLNPYSFNVDKGIAVLEEAGYSLVDGHLFKGEEEVVLTFLQTESSAVVQGFLPYLTEGVEALGIQLEVKAVSFQELLEQLQNPESTGWSMFVMADDWLGDDPSEWSRFFHSQYIPLSNVTRYSSPQVDALLEAGSAPLNLSKPESLDIYRQVLGHLNEDLPEIPLYTNNRKVYQQEWVKGLEMGTYETWAQGIETGFLAEKPESQDLEALPQTP